jgi:hypothetical protein
MGTLMSACVSSPSPSPAVMLMCRHPNFDVGVQAKLPAEVHHVVMAEHALGYPSRIFSISRRNY